MKIKISVGDAILEAELSNNETAKAIYNALPFDLPYNVWGDEIYFGVPVRLEQEEGQEIMEAGDIAYWPPGHAFCIFYGRTPASMDDRPRAASKVTRFGKIIGDATALRNARGDSILVEKFEEA
ncbi:MAG: cyclophilin-like fold protein [Candidatus Omnitrophota bacterium]